MKQLSILAILALLILPVASLASLYLMNPSLKKEPANYGYLYPDYSVMVAGGGMTIYSWNNLAF
ncbi:hypothetical protein [Cycloclasticus pugetii]|uniref:hypothetical protein n=1 Tax=Cycloclasticus pugetii TaxID=34068 RepID=UPI003A8F67FF